MKLQKLAIPLAAAMCALALCNTRADVTNVVTFSATTFTQGNSSDNGTTTTYAATITSSHNTADLIKQLGGDTGNTFTKAAKLVLIIGNNGANFAVVDGANFVDVPSIMSANTSDTKVLAGTANDADPDLASPTRRETELLTLTFDDTAVNNNSPIQFTLTGLLSITKTDTTPVNNIYTETFKGKVTSMTGTGSGGSGPFIATGTLSLSGKGPLTTN